MVFLMIYSLSITCKYFLFRGGSLGMSPPQKFCENRKPFVRVRRNEKYKYKQVTKLCAEKSILIKMVTTAEHPVPARKHVPTANSKNIDVPRSHSSPVLSIGSSLNPIPVKLSYIIHPPSLRFTSFSSSPICYPHCEFSGPSIVCSTGQVSSPVPLATLHYISKNSTCVLTPFMSVYVYRKEMALAALIILLDNIVLRISVWIVGIISCVGNLFVFISRIVLKEPNEVHSFFIKNLSVADLLMGVYLLIIAKHDTTFRGEYIRHERMWRYSMTCNWCGFISTVSSEASVIILTIITMDRYASITHPLTAKRRSMLCASTYMFVTWIIAILISVVPVLGLSYFDAEFYSGNGVCLPLQIHNPYGQGWEYSTFIFVGVNLLAFMINLLAYVSMFITIRRSKLTLRSTQQQQDRTIAKRFAFIVGTDFVCWMPIIITKILAHSGLPTGTIIFNQIDNILYIWTTLVVP
ncbi:G-protein coupled receptor GRL101 [Nymphon striatum]|nr:G-protein coupled receptor GRL101 [Nymphon striatum]